METVASYFGSMVFNDEAMRERLPKDVYKALKETIREGKDLDLNVANSVANAMKNWAIEKGATHFTHWFQPLTGMTAEKHDAFITPLEGGKVILDFSGKELIKGEPDASSFPSGGLRATFEARGYTAWDPTSYAFIKEDTLCIPTAFCSYSGEVLDKKTPLLRSMEAISEEAVKILSLFGKTDVKRVITTVGAEQEYFLIDEEDFKKRKDLRLTGRTLFGARSPKGQEKDDHYFGALRTRVAEYMADLDRELWKLGIPAKTSHNEVAPCQHELAPVFSVSNVAVDHNQIMMELMKKIAPKHGFACILHEKPFEGVNGSGKHNNWSISTDTGVNLLEPGDNPKDNLQFLLFLSAVIKAVDEYQDLLRISVASAGNDHRLGANEAPPAIVSIFVGDELEGIIESIELDNGYEGKKQKTMKLGAKVLPRFLRDTTDRNRTSPFAFTGNKFEFRMLGSSASISDANIYINSAVASVLDEFADILEKSTDFETDVHTLTRDTFIAHKRIIFNGNGYDESWVKEAEKRGLSNYRTTPDCIPHMLDKKNVELLTREGIFSEKEIKSRVETTLENYSKTVLIEANTMVDMAQRDYLPAIEGFTAQLLDTLEKKEKYQSFAHSGYEKSTIGKLSVLSDAIASASDELSHAIVKAKGISSEEEKSYAIRDTVIPLMQRLRASVDEAETICASSYWPVPVYGDLLFSVR